MNCTADPVSSVQLVLCEHSVITRLIARLSQLARVHRRRRRLLSHVMTSARHVTYNRLTTVLLSSLMCSISVDLGRLERSASTVYTAGMILLLRERLLVK